MTVPAILFRQCVFYIIELMDPSTCGRTLEQQGADNAELNPGTLRVEDAQGNVLWRLQ